MLFFQISPGPGGDNIVEGIDEGGEEDEALCADQAASESVNRSSSFLFDSLYDSSLLAGLSPQQLLDQSDQEEIVDREIRDKRPLPSTQQRRRSELLANQEAEEQEAIQWGESSFNLSEWGDSLLVGEHFLKRQSLLKHSHRKAQQPNADHVLPEKQLSESKPREIQPQPTTTTTTTTQNECGKDKGRNNKGHTQKIKLHNTEQNDNKPGGRQKTINVEGENAKQIEKKIKKGEGMGALLSDNAVLKHPHVQNAPESTLYCSPGLQDIFDRWPSMSDQPWQNTTTGHAATHTLINAAEVPDVPQPSAQVDRKRGKLNVQVATAESDSREEQPSRRDSEDVTERPGSAGDLIPPTQETPPVTPRVKLTTTSVQSPLTAQPLSQSTPSTLLPRKPAITKCPKSRHGLGDHLSEAVADIKQPNSTSDRSCKQQPGQKPKTLPVPLSSSKTKPLRHTDHDPSPPRDRASPSSPRPKPPSNVESPVTDEGFTLQLSQDASLCSSNSGTFSIIDVASDRRLFDTFINEWKTKERYSLALACEKRERRQQPEGEIGGKHKRGN